MVKKIVSIKNLAAYYNYKGVTFLIRHAKKSNVIAPQMARQELDTMQGHKVSRSRLGQQGQGQVSRSRLGQQGQGQIGEVKARPRTGQRGQ